MRLQEYYNIIISKYSSGLYKTRGAKHIEVEPVVIEKEFPLHALNYLIFEYMKDNRDSRWRLLLDFVLVPDGVDEDGCDIDFTQIEFEDFFKFMLSVKS